jgi:uridine kinase
MYLIGITGMMDSGKTTFANHLLKNLSNSEIVSVDELIREADDITADKMDSAGDLAEVIKLYSDKDAEMQIVSELLDTRAKEIMGREGVAILEGSILHTFDIWKRCNTTIWIQASNKARERNSKLSEAFINGDIAVFSDNIEHKEASYHQLDTAMRQKDIFKGLKADIIVKNTYNEAFEREAFKIARTVGYTRQRKSAKKRK